MNSAKFKDALYEQRQVTDIKDLICSSAQLFQNNTAFMYRRRHSEPWMKITYGQFKMEIDALGTALCHQGLRGSKIAVIGENSYEWVLSYMAITMGTGIVVPIDRELKPTEIANLLQRAEVEAVIYSKKMERAMKEIIPQCPGVTHFINMNKEEAKEGEWALMELLLEGKKLLAQGDRTFVDAVIDPDQVCAVLFTSGTTGLAKGVMLSHKNIISNTLAMSKYVFVEGETSLSVLPMHHTYEMTCHIFTGLFQGITIAVCEGLRYIQSNLQELHCNIMLAVPLIFESMYKRVMKTAEQTGKLEKLQKGMKLSKKYKLYNHPAVVKKMFKDVHESFGGDIKHFIVGGAAINPQIIEDFQAMGFPIFQGYGMTEHAPIIAVNKDRYGKSSAAGLPLPGTEVKITDPDESGMGEIICRGPSIMKGYYQNPKATAEAIVDGWLYTGDYGYFDQDGFLYVTGRKKSVIVTKNGKNIFPEEVEYYLTESDYIQEAMVHGVDSGTDKGTLVKAEIFPNYDLIEQEQGDLSDEELQAFFKKLIDDVNDKMPSYKWIQRFSLRETEFDKTTTRKIKRFNQENMNQGKEADM